MNNNNNHETIFWKVFRNIYIRNIILSKIKNNNRDCSYNGTTSLELMIENNKLHMILDKLKSNHYIHIDTAKLTNSEKPYDPYFKSITTEINQLLWSKYSLKLRFFDYGKQYSENIIKRFNLWRLDNEDNNKAHSLLYTLLGNSSSFIQTIKYLNQHINNNKEYNKITKKQKINHYNNNNNNNNDNNQYFIKQLTSKSSTPSTPENEIINAIYNNQPIPTHLDIYYSNKSPIHYDQDLFEQLKVDFRSVLLNIRQNSSIYNCNNKEVLELILLKSLYHKYSIKLNAYPVNSLLHAKIYCLSKLNRLKKTAPKFKQYLINNQVNTLEELISVAKDTLAQDGEKFNYVYYFGDYYYYYIITSNKFDELKENNKFPKGFDVLLLKCSILTQQTELFDKLLETYKFDFDFRNKLEFQSIRNSIGNGFNNNNDNNNKLIKEKSTTYFNHIINQTNQFLKDESIYKDNWFHIFKLIINSYNSKLFEWLLESNTQLKDIYYKLLGKYYFKELFIYHSRIDVESDQLDCEMFDVLIKHIKIVENKEFKLNLDFSERNTNYSNTNYSTQIKVQILNHLTKSPSNIQSSTISKIICILIEDGFDNLELADEIIKVYNQIDQQQLFNYYNSNHNQYSKFLLSTYQNKSSILVKVLIHSIINLDFESINKIISATLNNNNNISTPTTFNNSLDIIKYLISNKYLKEFSLYYMLKKIIFNIQVDKEYIIELIRLSNNETNNTATTTTITTDELIEEIEIIYNEIEQKRNKQIENEIKENEKNNQLFTLSTLERIRDEARFKTKNYEFLDETILRYNGAGTYKYEFLGRCIGIYCSWGYYNTVYQFLNNNKDIDINFSLIDFDDQKISIEWISKLYPVLFKNALKLDSDRISEICYHNPPEIFEFIWNNHFKYINERRKYISDLLYNRDYKFNQLMEYVLKNKKEFIITTVKPNQDKIYKLHQYSLFNDTQLFHQVRSTFPSFNFQIKYEDINFRKTFHKSFLKYHTIEYLYLNNLIPNLEQIIGTSNLNKFRIKEHNEGITSKKIINISKSKFILIHTIIKLQKEQQQQQQQQ